MVKTVNGKNDQMLPVTRTSAGLRDALFDELDRLRQGKTNATNANATAKLASTIVDTVQMELQTHKWLLENKALTESQEKTPSLPGNLILSSQ